MMPRHAKPVLLSSVAALLIAGGVACGSKADIGGGSGSDTTTTNSAVSTSLTTDQSSSSNSAKTATGEMSVKDIVDKAGPSVVRIETDSGVGSGFIVSSDGNILTNYHVIEGGRNIRVTLDDGTELTATVKGTDERSDLALLDVDGSNLPALSF